MATEACCTPAPPAEHIEEGTTKKFGNLDAYINPGPEKATSAIIFVSDVFGYDPPLLRKLADRSAAEDFFVVVPDLFHGDPLVLGEGANRLAAIPGWMAKHPPTDLTDIKAVIKQLREQGLERIGVTGCCWGGKVATCLAIEDEPLIDAVVLFHPSLLTDDDVRAIKVPVLFLIPEIDQQVPPEKAVEFKDILASKPEVESNLRSFPGMKHGFCVRSTLLQCWENWVVSDYLMQLEFTLTVPKSWKQDMKSRQQRFLRVISSPGERKRPSPSIRGPKFLMLVTNVRTNFAFAFKFQALESSCKPSGICCLLPSKREEDAQYDFPRYD